MADTNGRTRWLWAIPVALTLAGALVGYGSLKSDVSHTANEVSAVARAVDQKADLQLVSQLQEQILDQLHEVNARLGRLETRGKGLAPGRP
jgi:uncharacterized protein HemX